MSPPWLNPAGGLRYHVRALRSRPLWQPFRHALSEWLSGLDCGPRAVFVGPSAAYTVDDAFLSRFSAITVLDPDPIARFLLLRRLRALGVETVRWETRDLLIRPMLEGTPGLVEMLTLDPTCGVVFANVLGQTRFLLGDADFERFKAEFRARLTPLLANRAWLSFHDRVSGEAEPSFDSLHQESARLEDAELEHALYTNNPEGARVELFDHESDGFFPAGLPHCYFKWHIAERRFHLIEAVSGRATPATSTL